jgi:hypothetical protein
MYIFDWPDIHEEIVELTWKNVRIWLACYTRRDHGIDLEECTYLTGLTYTKKSWNWPGRMYVFGWPDIHEEIVELTRNNIYIRLA